MLRVFSLLYIYIHSLLKLFRINVDSSLNIWCNSPVRLSRPGVSFWGRFLVIISGSSVEHRDFQIFCFCLCQFWQVVFSKKLVHFIQVVKFICMMLFIVFFFHAFNVYRICDDKWSPFSLLCWWFVLFLF